SVCAACAFGAFACFFVMWSYWISLWVTNAALGIGVVSYLSPFAPGFFGRPLVSPAAATAFVVSMTLIALRGVKASGRVQIATTVLKVLPLFAVILALAIVFGVSERSAGS